MRQEQLTTRINVEELLVILKKNRSNHKKIFLEAVRGYKREMIKYLRKMLKDVRAGKSVHHHITLSTPCNMTSEYDTVIRMLEMHSDETIELTMETFMAYVEDKWGWKRDFLMSNAGYSQTANILSAQM